MAQIHPLHKRILVIDGGGFRGLGCLMIVDKIMKEVATRSRRSLMPCQVFDLICGSSTGGLLALLLGRFGLDCSTAMKVYKMLAKSIFGDVEQVFWDKLVNSSDFNSKLLEDALGIFVTKYGGDDARPMMLPLNGADAVSHQSTKTFVTVACYEPDYPDRIYHIRSYPTPNRATASSPPNYQWSVREAARAIISGNIYLSPLLIQNNDVGYEFRDAGTLGFVNPTDLVYRESEKLWPDDRIGVVVSLGTGLSGPAPSQRGAVTDNYIKPFIDDIISKLSYPVTTATRKRATIIIKKIMSAAVDTQLVHSKAFSKSSQNYYRIDPPLGLGNTDLVDCFHVDQVEKAISEWLDTPEHTQYICDIASQLVNRDTEPVTVEQARTREPPPPPPETNPGYNPQLDKKRPETMMDYLRKYHVLFVIDDSGSMTQDNRWGEARDALVGVAEHAVKYGYTEIDMRFFNSSKKCQDVKSVDIVVNIFNQTTPKGVTPTGAVLKEILDDHILKLDAAVNQSEYYDIKPLDVIVITDGIPTDKPKDVLVEEALRIRSRKHHPNCVGIQFVQIGSDDNAEAALKDLMFGNIGNMVDTVPYTAVLTPQRLERILLGGIQPNVRALLPIV